MEHVSMMEGLAGNDASTGVTQIALPPKQHVSLAMKTCQTALYDTLILSYFAGYSVEPLGDFCVPSCDPLLHAAAYTVIKLAITVMANYVA